MNSVRFFVATKFPALAGVTFGLCSSVRKDAPDPARAYMHVGHRRRTICVADEAVRLSPGHLLGLTLHEFGHLATGGGDAVADGWVFREFGLVIAYRGPGALEWVSADEAKRVGL